MKYVINTRYGGFSISEECKLAIEANDFYEVARNNDRLIAFIEEFGSERASGRSAKLKIVELPDEATDWMLEDYDGAERIIAVVDGKLQLIS